MKSDTEQMREWLGGLPIFMALPRMVSAKRDADGLWAAELGGRSIKAETESQARKEIVSEWVQSDEPWDPRRAGARPTQPS